LEEEKEKEKEEEKEKKKKKEKKKEKEKEKKKEKEKEGAYHKHLQSAHGVRNSTHIWPLDARDSSTSHHRYRRGY
jgi:hypothetical protein